MFILAPDFDSCNLFCELRDFLGKGYKRFNDIKIAVYSLCSLSGAGVHFRSKEDFITRAGVPEKVGGVVWDFLKEKEYLVQDKKGFTTFPWLKENGWISKEIEGNPLYVDSYPKEEIRPYVFLGKIGYKTVLDKYGDKEKVDQALDFLSQWKEEKIVRGELREDFNDIVALRSFVFNRIMKK